MSDVSTQRRPVTETDRGQEEEIAGKVRAAAHGTWHMAAGQPVSVRSHSFVPRPVDSGATEAARSLFLLCW